MCIRDRCDIHVENREICLPDRLYSEDWNEVVVLICAPEKYYREISRSLDEIGIVDVFFLNEMCIRDSLHSAQ